MESTLALLSSMPDIACMRGVCGLVSVEARGRSIFGWGENAMGDHRFDHEFCRECFGVSKEIFAVPTCEAEAIEGSA